LLPQSGDAGDGMRSSRRRTAWLQGTALLFACGVLVTLLVIEQHRSFDQETLGILTGELRSDAREARELVRLDAQQASFAIFTQQHARQLGQHVADVGTSLRDNQAIPPLEPMRRDAMEIAESVNRSLSAIASDSASANVQAAALDRLRERADAVHRRVKPRD
jgi:hypothetical protein